MSLDDFNSRANKNSTKVNSISDFLYILKLCILMSRKISIIDLLSTQYVIQQLHSLLGIKQFKNI